MENNSNNFFDNNSLIMQSLTSHFMDNRGWTLYDKDGQFINCFTSLEIFQYLTYNIIGNNINIKIFKILN